MDMGELMQKYPNVSRVELEKIRERSQFENSSFVWKVERLNKEREYVKTNGRISVEAGPIVQVLSVHVIPSDKLIDRNKPQTIYGRIYVEYRDTRKTIVHDVFSRKCDDAQVLGPSGGPLTLVGPDNPCCRRYGDCTPLNNNTRLVVDVFIGEGGNKLFAEKRLCCEYEDMTIDMEKIELECVYGEHCSLALHYIVMPMAVYGNVNVAFFCKQENQFINVKGRIVARYGNVKGSKFTLFEKEHDNEFERVERKDPELQRASMGLSRCWVGVPIYSSLILDLDLSEFETGCKIVKETLEFRVTDEVCSDHKFIFDDDIYMLVSVTRASPTSQGRLRLMELDDDECSGDDEHIDEASCVPVASPSSSFFFRLEDPGCLANSVEIFSVFIYREKYKPLQVYGSIQVASEDYTFYVFKRDTKNDAFGLPEHSKTLPILDGPRLYEESYYSLEMKIDLKDVESSWYIKGYVHCDRGHIEDGSATNRQLCSVIHGQNGNFAAIHYTIFQEEAFYAIVGLLCIPKNGGHFRPKVHGCLVAKYNNYDYTTRYNKDYYRIVLFQRNRDDAAQPGTDGFIPLSRSVVAVLRKSSLIIEANIGDGLSDELSFRELEFKVCAVGIIKRKLIMERNDYSIYIYVRWDA